MRKIVSAIVPVFNEEKTVGGVVETLLKSSLVTEVIVVNDGSEDKSLKVLKRFNNKIKLLSFQRNRGKGFVMARGVKEAKGEIVAFFDSDLLNLSAGHIKTLLEPILDGEAEAVLGYPKRGNNYSKIFSHLTGERAYFRNRLLPHLEKLAKTRLGAETFLNSQFKKEEMRTIPLEGLVHLQKYEKLKFSKAVKDYLLEAVEIAQEIGRREGVLPEDYQKIKNLIKVKTLRDFKVKIDEIKNEKVRRSLKRYILRYATLAKRKLQDFL